MPNDFPNISGQCLAAQNVDQPTRDCKIRGRFFKNNESPKKKCKSIPDIVENNGILFHNLISLT